MTRRVLYVSQPIVDTNGVMSQPFQEWQELVGRAQLLRGTGSPEGSIEAPLDSRYIDTSGAPGSLLYIKVSADIGGDRTQGWVLV